MDQNKLNELRTIGFRIPKTCGLCKHGVFVGASDWGTCAVRTYEHLKHSGPPRQLSVYRGGSCPDKFDVDPARVAQLGAWAEFVL